jgi:hypothetical protein
VGVLKANGIITPVARQQLDMTGSVSALASSGEAFSSYIGAVRGYLRFMHRRHATVRYPVTVGDAIIKGMLGTIAVTAYFFGKLWPNKPRQLLTCAEGKSVQQSSVVQASMPREVSVNASDGDFENIVWDHQLGVVVPVFATKSSDILELADTVFALLHHQSGCVHSTRIVVIKCMASS